MFRKIVTAAFAAALAIALFAPAVEAQKALVYCPVGVDAAGCDRIVTALQSRFSDGVDRGYDGSNGTVDLTKVDLQHYGVFVVPSLADDATKQPYALLRSVASRLRFAINGRVAVYSGAPDQGNSNRGDKDALIQNLATWAANGHTRTAGLVGLVAFLDLSEQIGDRYSWVRGISLADVSADAELQAFSDVTPVSTRGGNVFSAGGRSVRFSNMTSYGLHIGRHAAARTEVGALGGGSKSQSVLVMYSNADGKDNGTGGATTGTGQVGSSSASLDVIGVKASLSTTASTSSTATTSGTAIVTDKPDYQPGDTVTFTGTGFAAGDTVTITVHEDPTWSYPDRSFVSVSDGNGAFVNRQMVVVQQDLGVTFTATAVGNPSGLVAQTTFTDGNVVNNGLTVGTDQTPDPVPAGATATFTVSVAFGGNNTACTVTLSATPTASPAWPAPPVGGFFSFSPASVTGAKDDTPKTSTLTITVPSGTTPNTYGFKVDVALGTGCDGSPPKSGAGSLVVRAPLATSVAAPSASATFGDALVGLSANVSATSSVSAGTVTFTVKQGATVIGSPVTSGTVSSGAASVTYTLPTGTAAGSYTVLAEYTGGGGFAPSSNSGSLGTLTIAKANASISVTPYDVTFDGSPHTATGTATGIGGSPLSGLDLNGTTHTDAGTYGADGWSFTDVTGNYNNATGTVSDHIAKASSVTTVTCPATATTYTGAGLTPCTAAATGVGDLNQTLSVFYTDNTNAGTAHASGSFTGDANHDGSNGTATFEIGKAASLTTITCPASATYDGTPLTPCTAAVAGAGGLNLTPTPTYANNINAGTATASYSFAGDANHESSSDSKTFTIEKASSVTTVTCLASVTYNGTAQTPCSATATGAGGLSQSVTVSYSNNTDAGTASASASFAGDGNHDPSNGNANFTIEKAASTTTVAADDATYDGSPHGGTATANGAGGLNQSVPVTYAGRNGTTYGPSTTAPAGAGDYTASASFAGDANHLASSGAKDYTIAKAASVTAVSCPASVTYSGSTQTPCTATVTGAGGLSQSLSVSYSNNTNAGTASANASYAGDDNHLPSSDSKTFEIQKAPSTTTITCPASVTYSGSAQEPCSATASGAGGLNQAVTVTYADNVNAGTATATANYGGDANHNASNGSKTFTIDKAPSVTTVSCPSAASTYTGSPITPCTAQATGAGGLSQSLAVSYTDNTNVGTAHASANFAGDGNHEASSNSATFEIAKAPSTTTITCPASVTFDGTAQTPCGAVATGVGGLSQSVVVSYGTNTNAGTATASANFGGDANHDPSSDTKTFTINKAASATAVTCPASVTFDGSAKTPCTAVATGAGGLSQALTVSYTDNTNAGTAHANASFGGDANHEASSGSATFAISKAASTTTVACPASVTYNGSAQTPCTAAVTGVAGLNQPLTVVYGNNTNAGTATASASFAGDANHDGSSDAKTFTINKASATVTLSNLVQPFNGSPRVPSYVTSPANVSVTLTYVQDDQPATPIEVGVYSATASIADPNYTGPADTELFVIYDASAGFVTGGGWIMSSAGAYAADPSLAGKANFGFVSKYQKGATAPTGNTEFQFQAGNLNFKSTNFQWLVISSSTQAQFKGIGTINGQGNYNFLVTAIDGDNFNGTKKSDGFRIKITDALGTVVYDNMQGADETSAAAQSISGGSIQIRSR